ncbi:hypothetical protein Nepgr_001475 [Nepenthes gracilis]|uniref:beta-galactosidase n=1 Tax=Nepenthes gracilis TaxID=150966 RepID=A0AAD3P4J2_NEPGR|nr:hypothetical protein Nepgr_001475 [Nepenthes gracilis]
MGREGGVRGGVLPALLVLLGALATASLGATVTYDHRALVIDGKRRVLISGSIHYPRSIPEMWPDLIQKSKERGLDIFNQASCKPPVTRTRKNKEEKKGEGRNKEKGSNEIVFKAMGRAINKTFGNHKACLCKYLLPANIVKVVFLLPSSLAFLENDCSVLMMYLAFLISHWEADVQFFLFY